MNTAFTYHTSWTPGLHLGVARLAMLNWQWARETDGHCVLFCNDINEGRQNYEDMLPNMLEWLGIRQTHGPYRAVHNKKEYDIVIKLLLDCNMAYRDYATPEEVHAEREAARRSKKPFVYSRRFMATSETDAKNYKAEGRKPVVRLKMPRSDEAQRHEEHIIDDLVFGKRTVYLHEWHDCVIRRSDGRYTSLFTDVVDYHLHYIDRVFVDFSHFQALPAQIFIANRAHLKLPTFVHIPHLGGPVGSRRFSVSHLDDDCRNVEFAELVENGVSVDRELPKYVDYGPMHPCYVYFYKKLGFLPESLRHYLWETILDNGSRIDSKALSKPPESPILDLGKIGHSPVAFDSERILGLQEQYMDECHIVRKAKLVYSILREVSPPKPKVHEPSFVEDVPPEVRAFVEDYQHEIILGSDILMLMDQLLSNKMEPSEDHMMAEGCPNGG